MGVFQYEKVKDPTYYGENRVPAHSDHRYYGSVEEMEQHVENFRHSLNLSLIHISEPTRP